MCWEAINTSASKKLKGVIIIKYSFGRITITSRYYASLDYAALEYLVHLAAQKDLADYVLS